MPSTSPPERAIVAAGKDSVHLQEMEKQRELAAIAFDRWAGAFALVPKPPRQFIRDVETKYEFAALLTTECEGRRVVWKEVAYRGTARVQPLPLKPSDVSPWSVDESALRLRSDHVSVCDSCNGEGKRTCEQCGGGGHLRCGSCNGSGKVYGYTSNGARRLLNCKLCHGRGALTCPDCRRGMAVCGTCEGQKRVQRWLEVMRWHRTDDTAYPAGVCAAPLSWAVNADNTVLERDAAIRVDVSQLRALAVNDVGPVEHEWLQKIASTIASPPTSEERIVRQHFRLVAIPRLLVSYEVGSNSGAVEFLGHRLLPVAGQPQFFERRARRLRMAGAVFGIAFLLTAMAYLARASFYWHAAGLSAVAALGVAFVCLFMMIAEATASRRRLKPWALAMAAMITISAISFGLAHPTIIDARARFLRGDTAGAAEELSAIDSDAGDARVAPLWADLHLANAQTAATYGAARKEADAIPKELLQYRHAIAAVDDHIRNAVDRDLTLGDLNAAASAFAAASLEWQQSTTGIAAAEKIYLHRAASAIERLDWHSAADDLMRARKAGVATDRLTSAAEPLQREARRRTRSAANISSSTKRLFARITAENAWIQWERAVGTSSPELTALRTAMAGDLHNAESRSR